MSIYVCGDFHGTLDIRKIYKKNWPESENCKILFELGDFGFIFSPEDTKNYRKEQKQLNHLSSTIPFTLLVVLGNHENYDIINKLPEIDIYGGKVKKLRENIFFLNNGEIYVIDDKKYFVFGGAASTDKERRIEGISWWKEEVPDVKTMNFGLDNLAKYNYKVDFILSHTAPASFIRKLCHYFHGDTVSNYLEEVKNRTKFRQWHFGHLHMDEVDQNKFFCVRHVNL